MACVFFKHTCIIRTSRCLSSRFPSIELFVRNRFSSNLFRHHPGVSRTFLLVLGSSSFLGVVGDTLERLH